MLPTASFVPYYVRDEKTIDYFEEMTPKIKVTALAFFTKTFILE